MNVLQSRAEQVGLTPVEEPRSANGERGIEVAAGEGLLEPAFQRPWHWEGSVQSALRRFLEREDWSITADADTEGKAPGADLAASKDGRRLVIEVKGYPSTTYEYGPRRGQPKPTRPTSQARQWFAHALAAGLRLRDKPPNAEVALCFPDFQTYRRLLRDTSRSLRDLNIGVYLVREDGDVEIYLRHFPV